jgi:hypothetical protein
VKRCRRSQAGLAVSRGSPAAVGILPTLGGNSKQIKNASDPKDREAPEQPSPELPTPNVEQDARVRSSTAEGLDGTDEPLAKHRRRDSMGDFVIGYFETCAVRGSDADFQKVEFVQLWWPDSPCRSRV